MITGKHHYTYVNVPIRVHVSKTFQIINFTIYFMKILFSKINFNVSFCVMKEKIKHVILLHEISTNSKL